MIREGITGREVAKRLGVSQSLVSKWRNAAGLGGKRGGRANNSPHHSTTPHSPEIKEKALQMISDGATIREIEGRLEISYNTIYAWVRKAELTSVEKENDVIDLLRDGKSQAEVNRITGVRVKTIRAWKKQAEKEGFL